MTGLELLEKYPRAASVIKNWLLWKMVEALQNESIDEEFKQYMRDQGIENDKIAPMIDANPRMLLDVFDENDVIIIIKYHENFGFTSVTERSFQGFGQGSKPLFA
jgi:esterase/lipase superfamily enzyme